MKIADIEVGAEYALGSPNHGRCTAGRAIHVRVTRVRVHGAVRSHAGWYGPSVSTHANYVEFEPVDSEQKPGWTYTSTWVVGQEKLGKYRNESRPTEERHRAMSSHIKEPWADYEQKRKVAESHAAIVRDEEAAERGSRDAQICRARGMGIALRAEGLDNSMVMITADNLRLLLDIAEGE